MKNLYFDNGFHKELKAISVEEDKTLIDLIEEIIREYLKKRKEKK